MASRSVATSADGTGSLGAAAKRGGRLAACGVLAVVVAFAPAFAGASAGRGLGSGAPPAEATANALTRVPAVSAAIKDCIGAPVLKAGPVPLCPRLFYSLD